ncbi:hypothetical protein [Janthinobacterium sp. HH01]|nr:hypothetical protein [Janthinobacterium sp. HH01]
MLEKETFRIAAIVAALLVMLIAADYIEDFDVRQSSRITRR